MTHHRLATWLHYEKMQTLASREHQSLVCRDQHSQTFIKQIFILDEIREKIFKYYAAKSMDEVCEMLVEGSLYIERNPELVKSMTSFPYIASSIWVGVGISMNNRQPSPQFFNPVTLRFSCSESAHAPRGGV
jgi:hypothetical protein